MLRITVNKSASAAKKYYSEPYYSEGKSTQDYYSEKDQSMGKWGGLAAEKLGLVGDIKREDFAALCDNQIPGTYEQLTDRKNLERRVGYDFTFNAQKSISLAYTFGTEENRKEILKAFRESVKETMSEIETGMQVRVRKKGQNENRETGNIVYGEFVHFTSRPINQVPDPHLHAHCFVLNTSWDSVEQKWKAGEFGQIKKDAPYYEAIFHATLANKLQDLGYPIDKKEKGFEIKGVPRETIEKFSRRTKEIEDLAAEKNITDAESKSALGARTRESKRESASPEDQTRNWNDRLTSDEKKLLRNLKSGTSSDDKKKENAIAIDAVDYSLKHHLERKSVATDREILTTAIKSSLGQTIPEMIRKAFKENRVIIAVKEAGQLFITTKDALQEENNLIARAMETKGRFKPINEHHALITQSLTDEQKNAVHHALNTTDGITIIAGRAGTGKTTLMKEVQNGIRESGKEIFAFAPSAEASRVVQRKEGFENAETIALLIQNKALQKKIKNSVVWIDEAGMMSNKDMNKVLEITKEQNARLILTGDTKQHSSVERGDALRILQTEAGIRSIQVSKIQRQKNEGYREAVFSLSKSDVQKGFQKLDKIGAIHEIEDAKDRIQKIAEDYFTSTYKSNTGKQLPKEVLVVSPTHIEGEKVTASIREKLKEENIIGQDDRNFRTFKNLQLTVAEKGNHENYARGNWIIFHQNTKGFKAGSRYPVKGIAKDKTVIIEEPSGSVKGLPLEKSSFFHVYEERNVAISKGDKIRITGNGKAEDGKHLFNGTLYNVIGFDRTGNMKLSNGSLLSKDYGQFVPGYVMTSHASQGKTVDKVIISQSSMSFRASSQEQFYVSVSRGRQAVAIYTDDKADLLHAISNSGERKSATELTKENKILNRVIEVNRIGLMNRIRNKAFETVHRIKSTIDKNKNHELPRQGKTKDSGKDR